MNRASVSLKEVLWLSCRQKACCSHYSVAPTGADLWRISEALQLPPWSFTRYTDATPGGSAAFALNASAARYQVVLAKRVTEPHPPPCTFLLRLPDGHAQCGLGELRPSVCRAFPAVLVRGIVCVGENAGCTCRTWAASAFDEQRERELLERLEAERAEYAETVADWNERVTQDSDGERTYFEFCDHLMNVYAKKPASVGGAD